MPSRLAELDAEQVFDVTRQRDIFDPHAHEDARCVLVGAGGIGSATALALSKLGIPELVLIDFDEIEPHNIPNQMYPISAGGRIKVEALAEICSAYGASDITIFNGKVEDHLGELRGVVITGLDNMEARQEVWKFAKNKMAISRLIDGRLGREEINLFSINPMDIEHQKFYEENALYFDDENAEELACTERGIIDVSFTVASLITRAVRRHFAQKEDDPEEQLVVFNQNTLEVFKG